MLCAQLRKASALRVNAADACIATGLLVTAAQLVPLPSSILDRANVVESLGLAGTSTWIPLSMDPGATMERLVVGATVAAAYLAGRLGAKEFGRRHLIRAVAASTAVMACVAFGHELASLDSVFGVWTTGHRTPTLIAPLTNSNHLGGFLAFGAALWLGLAVSAREPNEQSISTILGVVCALGALGTASRGAALSLVAGLVWALVATVRWDRKHDKSRRHLLLLGVVTAVVGAAVVLGFVAGLHADFMHGEYSKIALISEGADLVTQHPLFGVGRGAFEAAFASHGSSVRFTHPENILVQWSVEWGIPATVLILWTGGTALWRAARSRQLGVTIASGAIGCLFLHDLADFVLEMPAVASVTALLFGALVRPDRGPLLRHRHLAIAAVVLGSVIVWLGADVRSRRPEAFEEHLAAASEATVDEVAGRGVALHPIDPHVTLFVSSAMVRLGRPEALRWINRTMVLAPSWPSPHMLAAHVLYRRGALQQALLEAREAMWHGNVHEGLAFLCAIAPRANIEDLVRVVPSDERGGPIGQRISGCLADRGEVFDRTLVDLRPNDVNALVRMARREWRAGQLEAALRALERAQQLAPGREPIRVLRSTVLADVDGPVEALAQLGEPRTWAGLVVQAKLAMRADDDALYEQSLGALRQMSAGEPAKLAETWELEGRILRTDGRVLQALRAFQRADQLDASEDRYLQQYADLAWRERYRAKAQVAYRELCRRNDERACRLAEKARNSHDSRTPLP